METHYFLVAHGSRDARSQRSFSQLKALFIRALAQQGVAPQQIHSGTLEFDLALDQQLLSIGRSITIATKVKILPLFLLPGTHVRSDLPEAVAMASEQLPHISFDLRPHLGSHPGLVTLLGDRISSDYPWILLAHGSRYSGGNNGVEEIASTLGVTTAYWSVEPTLEQRLSEMVAKGHQTIGVLPYFLFSGRITDGILEQVYRLRCRFSQLDLKLNTPLAPSPALAQLLVDLI